MFDFVPANVVWQQLLNRTSNHESGLALDIDDPWAWEPFLEAQGLEAS
jgi:hypothetical protein